MPGRYRHANPAMLRPGRTSPTSRANRSRRRMRARLAAWAASRTVPGS